MIQLHILYCSNVGRRTSHIMRITRRVIRVLGCYSINYMADLQFQEPQYAQTAMTVGPKGLLGLVIRAGLAKNERQASYLLLGVAVLALAAAVFVYLTSGSTGLEQVIPKTPYVDPPKPWAHNP